LAPAGCNVIQFGSMIKHETGKSVLSYISYGCYCGLGGSKQPLDATDWCCHAHDCCYKQLSSSCCSPKLVTYKYFTQGSRIICRSRTWRKRQSCECDRQAAECFRRTARTCRDFYKNYPNLLCEGPTPAC
ncbi:PA2GE phospholipase, partial [Herpetotheres cachinnans]|nr:PA2GE phospholipase [Herpetotheres cachinnans]